MFTISLRSRSRNEIFISNFKGFVLLLPTQTFFYFMAKEIQYRCSQDERDYLSIMKNGKLISIFMVREITKDFNEETLCVELKKSDVKKLIEELNSLIKNLD